MGGDIASIQLVPGQFGLVEDITELLSDLIYIYQETAKAADEITNG